MARVDILTDAEWLGVARKRLVADGENIGATGVQFLNARPAAANGAFHGFIGDSLPVRVRVMLANSEERDLAFFIKTVPDDTEKHTELAVMSGAFRKETGLYERLFPRMSELPTSKSEDARKSGSNETVPPCYPRVFHIRSDLIVMEDLTVQGFVERDRRNPFDFDHAALLMDVLGRFHAKAFLLEEEMGRETGQKLPLNQFYPDLMEENIFLLDESKTLGKWYSCTIKSIQGAVALIPRYKKSQQYKNIVNKLPDIFRNNSVAVGTSTKFRNILNHGDIWSNNILFRYENGRPTEARLLDFQLARYCPPAVDILQALHLTTRPPLREKHGAALLRRYHEALSTTLAAGDVDPREVLPWEELVASCDELRVAGLVIAPGYQHLALLTPDRLKKAMTPDNYEEFIFGDRSKIVEDCFREDEYYRERFGEQLCELVDVEVLGKDKGFWKRVVSEKNK